VTDFYLSSAFFGRWDLIWDFFKVMQQSFINGIVFPFVLDEMNRMKYTCPQT
jgi:hypothetical protein